MTAEARTRKVFVWLDRAKADLDAARQDYRDTAHLPYHACFWAQQATEKSLKAALIFANIPPDRDHALDRLARQLPEGWRARNSAGRLAALTEYAVDTRYPDARKEPTHKDAEDAIKTAGAVYLMVIRDLGDRGVPISPEYYPGPPKPRAQPPVLDLRDDPGER